MPAPTEFETIADKMEATTLPGAAKLYALVAGADRWISETNFFKQHTGNYSLIKEYATLAVAVSEIGSAQVTLEIAASTTVSASLTIPSNITLIFSGEGKISVSSGQTLTLNTGNAGWPLRQIFTGAGTVRLGSNIEIAYARWFGSAENNSTDDTTAIQKALDSFGNESSFRAGRVRVVGGAVISDTLTITSGAIILEGTGWGITLDNRPRGFIRWNGAAGDPMILIQDCVASGVRNLRLVGKTGARPTAAIEFRQGGGSTQDQPIVENVWIGAYFSSDTDTGQQFDAGILCTGAQNGDTGIYKNVTIFKCVTGVDIQNPNASISQWDTLQISVCDVGFKTVAPQHLITNMVCSLNGVDLELAAQGVVVRLHNYFCEGSGRMAIGSAVGPMRLVVNGGYFGALGASFGGLFTGEDRTGTGRRWMMDFSGNASLGLWLELRDFTLGQFGSPSIPVIYTGNQDYDGNTLASTHLALIIKGADGMTEANFDVGTDNDAGSSRYVVFERQSKNTAIPTVHTRYIYDKNDAEDRQYQSQRFDIAGKATIYGGPLKVKRLAAPDGVAANPTGSGVTTYGYRVSALTHDGETLASSTVTCVNAASLTPSVYNTLTWNPVQGAYAYKIYGRLSGSELLMKTFTAAEWGDTYQAMWRDDGSLTPSGALPSVNSTGNADVAGAMFLGHFTTTERDNLPNVRNGMFLYNLTVEKFQGRAAGVWVDFH